MPAPSVPAPWTRRDFLPEVRPQEALAALEEGELRPVAPEDLARQVAEGEPVPVFLARPGEDRLETLYAVPWLREALATREERRLRGALGSLGFPFGLAAGAAALMLPRGAPAALLPLLLALWYGGPLLQAWTDLRRLRRDPAGYVRGLDLEVRYGIWLDREPERPWRTWALTAAWALLFLLEVRVGLEASVARAALVKARVWAGEPWRLLTGAMLHGSPMHVLFNGMAFMSLSGLLERMGDRRLVLPLFLASALGGSLLSLVLLPEAPSLGASGGILGFLGFLLVLAWRWRSVLPPSALQGLLRSLGLIALLGLAAWSMIDNAGHLGGLVTGLAAGLLRVRPRTGPPLAPRRWESALDLASALALAALATFTARRLLG